MKLLDTTVAIDHLRGDPRGRQLLEHLIELDEVLLASEVTRFELLAGMLPVETDPTEMFMSALVWVPIDEQIARVAGSFASQYRKAHGGIDVADYLIAATASVLGAQLLTTNVRHFPMISGLEPAYST